MSETSEAPEAAGGGPADPYAVIDPLYRRYAGWLRAALGRRFGAAIAPVAEDLVQETYLRAARVGAAGPILQPQALLMRIASRLAIDHVRAAGRRAEVPYPPSASAPDVPAEQFDAVLLKQVILSLPEPYRDVFLLSRFAGLSYEAIAARLGVSIKVVEWRMSKALALCTARLKL